MSDRLTARSMQYAQKSRVRGARPANPRHAFKISARPGQSVWTGCDNLARWQLPDGHVFIDAPLAAKGMPDITITPGLTSGTANISGGVYKFLDDLGVLGDWMADKALNRVQLFGGTLEHFKLDEDDDLNDPVTRQRCLAYTFQIRKSIKANDAVYQISCEDINRNIDTDMVNRDPFRLHSTISSSPNAVIPITLPVDGIAEHDYTFEHGPDYLVHPSEFRSYLLINNEYISYTGYRTDELEIANEPVTTLKDPVRGLFGTTPIQHDVSEDTPVENRPKMQHVAYCEEDAASLAIALLTNRFLDGREWTHGLNIDPRWVNVHSFAAAAGTRRRTVRRHKKVNAKKYLEEQVLSKMPAILIPNPSGELQLQQVSFFQPPAVEDVIDETTCYGGDLSALTHDESRCKATLSLFWDFDPLNDSYRQETKIVDKVSASETLATGEAEHQCETITTSRSTESEVRMIGGILWAKHALPVKRITAPVTNALAHLLPGNGVLVKHYPKDYKNGTSTQAPITAPMLVGTVRDRQNDNRYSVDCVGYQAPPRQLVQGSEPMPVSMYMDNGTELPGVVNGVLTGNPALILNRKYFFLGDLTLHADLIPLWIGYGDFELWVRGVLLWAAQIRGVGRGMSSPLQGYHQAPPAGGSWTATVNRFVNSSGDAQGIDRTRVRSYPGSIQGRAPGDIADLVSVERGRLVGLPSMLAGAGGARGETSSWSETKDGSIPNGGGSVEGTEGARGGFGVKIVCAPGSGFAGNGSLDMSGNNGLLSDNPTSIGGHGAAGAGGARGHAIFLTDGIGTHWQGLNGNRLIAKDGISRLSGTSAPDPVHLKRNAPYQNWRSHYDPPQDASNQWFESHTVATIPASQTAVDTTYSTSFNEYFEDQPDGRSRIRVQNGEPGDGNKWDLWISPGSLATGGLTPELYVHDGSSYELVDWVDTRHATVYHAMLAIARRGGSYLHYGDTRPTDYIDGDEWINSSTALRWILYGGKMDVLIGASEFLVGANKWRDSNLVNFPDEQTVYVYDNLDQMPVMPMGSTESAGGGESGTFGAPQNVTANSTANAVTLNWDDVATATKYNIDRAIDGGQYQYLTTVAESLYTDDTVVGGQACLYRVNAITGPVGAEHYSAWSQAVEISVHTGGSGSGTGGATVPSVLNFQARVDTPTEIELTWTAVDGVDGYRVLRGSQLIATLAQPVEQYADGALTPSTAYHYSIRAYVGVDESAGASASATTTQGAGGATDLTAPTNLTIAIYSGTAAELSWTAVAIADRGTGTSYEIEQDGVQVQIYTDANINSHFMDSLLPGTSYNWRVRLAGGGDVSPWVTVSGTTNP